MNRWSQEAVLLSPEKDTLFGPTVHEKIAYQILKMEVFLVHPLTMNKQLKLCSIQDLTDKQANKIWADLRKKWGQKIIKPYLREYLIKKKKQFSEYFTVEKLDMQGRKNENIKRNMAFCYDINGFVDAVCEEKQIDKNEYDKVIETDDGKDSLKLVLIFTKLQQQM